jgi:hypothetical protein
MSSDKRDNSTVLRGTDNLTVSHLEEVLQKSMTVAHYNQTLANNPQPAGSAGAPQNNNESGNTQAQTEQNELNPKGE